MEQEQLGAFDSHDKNLLHTEFKKNVCEIPIVEREIPIVERESFFQLILEALI